MSVYLNKAPHENLKIQVVEDGEKGEVRLVYNNHAFVVCKTDSNGEHVVQIVDADIGVRFNAPIETTCWRR